MRVVSLLLAVAVLVGSSAAQPKVNVTFYGESLCPFCKQAMGGPVNETLTAEGVLDIMDFDYVPWGNAFYITEACGGVSAKYDANIRKCWDSSCGAVSPPADCFKGEIVCQHGSTECTDNIIQLCAKNASTGPAQYMPFMHCMEYLGKPVASCASLFGIDYSKVQACTSGTQATLLLQAAARTTALIPGGHPGVPYITVNGNEVSNTNYLLKIVCAAYTGPKPAGCTSVLTARRL
eukprot:TRINITY_DN65379_c0_g1_i1.p2 TRINITY_DN65379_c0_g1~~TRINITY_DN65379_c0_g1_i1.p2  ORF type:complete len:253 (+),score=92.39 TRINITY_DN65379_c0_g1_i1:55-759(+)